MPITVDKSSNVQFTQASTKLLDSIVQRLEQQPDHVKSVHVLPNFSVDADTSLKLGNGPIAQGLVVCVAKSYTLGPEDMQWFHPSIARGRSVFAVEQPLSKAQLASVQLDGANSSVGEYTISKPDDFGCEQIEHRVVVDVSEEEMLLPLYKRWIQQGITAGEIDKQWKRMKFGDTYSIIAKTEAMRHEIAQSVAPGCQLVTSDTVNAVLSDTEHIYFTNNAVRVSAENNILMKSSALGGYRMYNVSESKHRFYPASLGTSANYYSWAQMTPQNCARIENTCSWSGNLAFNTQVMTPPAISATSIRALEDEYSLTFQDTLAMRMSTFSGSDAFVDKLAPGDIYNLEPSPEHIKAAKSYITAPVNMEHPVMNELMHNIQAIQRKFPGFQLFNPKYMEGKRFKIPREVYKEIA
jgi:hypothetical protein